VSQSPHCGQPTASHYCLWSCRAAGAAACAPDTPICPPAPAAVIPPAATFRLRLVDSAPPSAVSAGLLAAQREKHTSNAKPRAPSVISGCFAALWLASARQSCAQRVPAFERPAGRGGTKPSASCHPWHCPRDHAAQLSCRWSMVKISRDVPLSMCNGVVPGFAHWQL
jgi:hypothetical protein